MTVTRNQIRRVLNVVERHGGQLGNRELAERAGVPLWRLREIMDEAERLGIVRRVDCDGSNVGPFSSVPFYFQIDIGSW